MSNDIFAGIASTKKSRKKANGGNGPTMDLTQMVTASAPGVNAAMQTLMDTGRMEVSQDEFDLATLFTLAQGDELELPPYMPGLSQEPLRAEIVTVTGQTATVRFRYYGVLLVTRTCKKTATGFSWA